MCRAARRAMILVLAIAGFSFLVALWMARWVITRHEGPPEMQMTANAIRQGAEGFLATQYRAIFKYAAIAAFAIFALYLTRPPAHAEISTFTMAILTACTFSTGAMLSGAAG